MSEYYPHTPLSKQLLSSIPKKVFNWLTQLDIEWQGHPGSAGDLEWQDEFDYGHLQVNFHGKKVRISWEGSPDDISEISGSEEYFEDIDHNLDMFTALEKHIYDELQILEDEKMKPSDD